MCGDLLLPAVELSVLDLRLTVSEVGLIFLIELRPEELLSFSPALQLEVEQHGDQGHQEIQGGAQTPPAGSHPVTRGEERKGGHSVL